MRIPVPLGTSLVLGGIVILVFSAPILATRAAWLFVFPFALAIGLIGLAFWVRRRNGL